MRKRFGWIRIRGRRGWALALLGGVAAGWLIYTLLPAGNRGVRLELMVLGADGRFAESISIPRHWAQPAGLEPGAVVRVPLILAVRNSGTEPAPPTRLELSLPTRYRISRADGRPLPAELLPGTPMARYRIDVPATRAASGALAGYLPVLDTVWLEPIIPSFYCIALSDSVPDFIPAPPAPVEAIARVRIFYSFTAEDLEDPQTGLLAVQLDPTLLELKTPPSPPVFPTEYHDPVVPPPFLGMLEYGGNRRALCGDPQDPIEILSTLWETPGGGRFFVLDYGGAPRKYLFDLNRDSIIELEMWDASGAGQFNARRQAHLPIPSFLLPPPGPPPFDASSLAALSPEELLALDRYGRAQIEPYRFQTPAPEKKPRYNRFRPGSIGNDDDDTGGAGITVRYWSDPDRQIIPRPGSGNTSVTQQQAPGAAPTNRQTPGPERRTTPHTTTPPALGRPVTPPSTGTPAAPPRERQPQPGEQQAKPQPSRPDNQAPKPENPVPKPETRRPERSEPKVLGKPLDSPPPSARPDTTGQRR